MSNRFVEFYQKYQGEIFGYIKRMVNDGNAARDLCQDVFVKSLQANTGFADESHIKNWLYRAARNHALNYLKHQRIRSAYIAEQTHDAHVLRSILPTRDEALIKAFRKLKENHRHALYLKEVAGYSYSEIAEKTGLSTAAVTSLLSRAKNRLKSEYMRITAPDWLQSDDAIENFSGLLKLFTPWGSETGLKKYINRQVRNYFTRVHKEWDTIRSVYISTEISDKINRFIRADKNGIAVDLGTGTGKMLLNNKDKFKYLIGIDNNSQMIRQARLKAEGLSNVCFSAGNLEDLPLRDASAAAVICNLSLHHIVEMQKTLDESARILQKNGRLILVDFYRHKRKTLWEKMRNIWLGFDPQALTGRLKQSGFTNITFHPLDIRNRPENPRLFCMTADKK